MAAPLTGERIGAERNQAVGMHCASGQARIQSWRECGRRGCRRQDFASVL